jgi:hypoxanthine phosphoribosyltransferase
MSPEELGIINKNQTIPQIDSEPKKNYYYWEKYHGLVKKLISNIDWTPNVIVSIGKGGSIPGVILAERYGVSNLNFGIKSYNSYNQSKIIEYQTIPSYEALRGAHVLLVDDLADTGETFKYALHRFKQHNVEYVKTAAVFKKSESKFVPDFYAEEVPSDVWIVQPWEF